MPTNTYVALDKVTVGTAVSSISFNSISSAYTDLIVVGNMAVTAGSPNLQFYVNTDNAGTSYSGTVVVGNGTGALSNRFANQAQARVTYYAALDTGFNSMWVFNFLNYANTTTYKSMLIRGGSVNASGSEGTLANVSLWRSTAAINSITISPTASTFITGSTFSLYGIAAEGVSPAAKATGGIITSDSQYYYHTFLASGTFTPTQSISADVLLVAGGGGSGCAQNATRAGGGGGAGGLRYSASQSLTATGYTVTVGGGGAAGISSPATSGTNGASTSFTGLTSPSGGGYGGVAGLANANNGGSGGGGADNNNPGTGISGEGNSGALGSALGTGGGGGGASAAAGTAPTGGTGATYFGTIYATGGDGGHTTDAVGVAGTANTGNGAKAGRGTLNGAAGGSGIVIVRYLKA